MTNPHRFRLRRAGVLNVWQYDEQVFDVEGGRLLLRGTNGAGKSKTLEMLLPFALDGDKARMTASGRHHTSLVWLMLDGYDGSTTRSGYVWVEFERLLADGTREHLTCGVGLRASASAKQVVSWHFTTPRRIGIDLQLEDEAGPLTKPRLMAELERSGHVFDSAPRYKEHVGRELFGLDPVRYDELLRLLYWLRQPQVGEDIDPARLADQLVQALPQVDDAAVRAAGDTFDELEAFGEQIDRKHRAASAVEEFAGTYARYARRRVADLASALVLAHTEQRRRSSEVRRLGDELGQAREALERIRDERTTVRSSTDSTRARLDELRSGPEALSERNLEALARLVRARRTATETAAEVAATAGDRAARGRGALVEQGRGVTIRLASEHERVGETSRLMTRSGWDQGLAVAEPTGVTDREHAQAALRAVTAVEAVVGSHRNRLGTLRAAVEVVDEARRAHEAARAAADTAARRAAEAEQALEQAATEERVAREFADELAVGLAGQLASWAAQAPGFEVVAPEPTAAELPRLPALARRAGAPLREEQSVLLSERRAELTAIEAQRAELGARRDHVLAEQEPLPPRPAWTRSSRDGLPGAPFWRLVDFRPEVAADVRAGVEAALEASGLLDAWVLPDGDVLDAERLDVVVTAGPPVDGPDLGAVLIPDQMPQGSGVPTAVVTAVLSRIGWGTASLTSVAEDGRWWLGALHGRATKPVAQYVGAGARQAERARRLAELDELLLRLSTRAREAEVEHRRAQEAVAAIDTWVDAVPDHGPLLGAWARQSVLEGVSAQARRRAEADGVAAQEARARASGAARELNHLATSNDLDPAADALVARRRSLDEVDRGFSDRVRGAAGLAADLQRWLTDDDRVSADEAERDRRREQATAATALHEEAAARLAETERAVGADVAELRRRVDELDRELDELGRSAQRLEVQHDGQMGQAGALGSAVDAATDRLGEARGPLVESAHAFAGLAPVPGVLDAVLGQGGEDARSVVAGAAVDVDGPDPKVARAAVAQARELADGGAEPVATNALLQAWQELQAGPGADVEPRLVDQDGTYVVIGRDESGEHPLPVLAPRLRASVEADRSLLTERERRLFEEHVLGQLGHALRERRREADDLVRAMNELLDGVSTSQGIRVRLRWRLREDIPSEARRAVELLGERLDALLPEERRELRDALHRLIEVSRSDAPEDSYTEHLARALDYRQWFEFTIRYLRPEGNGSWLDLKRRSPLSQGEQKVVCYLPLFAAAAAHYTSLAGAAPHSPRLVMLDDAFPKIDARTHPLLFGLLVDLDLDFVITSERLWGDHATVPSLAIYEALRDPGQRGIAQFHHRWDGRRLHAVSS